MSETLCHEISNIFQCPVSWAVSLGRNHHYPTSGGHIAHSTGNIVIISRRERWKSSIAIFHTSYMGISLHSSLVLEMVRIIWQAHIV